MLVEGRIQFTEPSLIFLFRNSAMPMTCQHRKTGDRDEHSRNQASENPRGYGAMFARHPNIQGVFHGTDLNAFETTHTLVAPHLADLVHLDTRRAGFGAQLAVNARCLVTGDLERT